MQDTYITTLSTLIAHRVRWLTSVPEMAPATFIALVIRNVAKALG